MKCKDDLEWSFNEMHMSLKKKEQLRISVRTILGNHNHPQARGVIERFHQSPGKSVRQAARETGVPKSSVHRILKRAQ